MTTPVWHNLLKTPKGEECHGQKQNSISTRFECDQFPETIWFTTAM